MVSRWVRLLYVARAATMPLMMELKENVPDAPDVSETAIWARALASVVLVLLGGVFAGLTIGLMGQDEVTLQVIAQSGEPKERKYAVKVLNLLAKSKHWVLVTLLLSNVITNETLPIVLDRILGGGWPAVVSSTAAIVIFGEIIPQSICVRYGLPLGAFFTPFVRVLMYLMYPVAVPIAQLLDYVLGEDHGTVYKKAGLKSLVTLHHNMGNDPLNTDEVTIISAVLDLKAKPVEKVMTPIKDVFVLSSDAILDESLVEQILLTGFNRIPIHAPGEPLNFMGMLLVRTLITYDPEDAMPISSFTLATLPETSPDTSCLNILNYFQEGKSHMVAVSTDPGAGNGVVGVVTLEDVIEELIGEEIVDESDVYVDIGKAIRRVNTPIPALRKAAAVSHMTKKLRPSNRAREPRVTHNSKITIKHPYAAEVVNSEAAAVSRNTGKASQDREHVAYGPGPGPEPGPGPASGPGPSRPDSSHPETISREDKDAINLRLGSFTENIVHVNGLNKVIIADHTSENEDEPLVRVNDERRQS